MEVKITDREIRVGTNTFQKNTVVGFGVGIYLDNNGSKRKLAKKGVEALNSKELLMVILEKGIKRHNVTVLATNILKLIEKERENLTLGKLEKIQGVGKARTGQILASFELAKQYLLKPEFKINNTG